MTLVPDLTCKALFATDRFSRYGKMSQQRRVDSHIIRSNGSKHVMPILLCSAAAFSNLVHVSMIRVLADAMEARASDFSVETVV
jgi:hypothetical protein